MHEVLILCTTRYCYSLAFIWTKTSPSPSLFVRGIDCGPTNFLHSDIPRRSPRGYRANSNATDLSRHVGGRDSTALVAKQSVRRETITSLHSISLVWSGLGASMVNLWQHASRSMNMFRTLSVFLYLVFISVLHVSPSCHLDFNSFNSTEVSQVEMTLGIPNMTMNLAKYDADLWNDAIMAAGIQCGTHPSHCL